MTHDALDALFGKADYSHIARDVTVTVDLTATEAKWVFCDWYNRRGRD